MANFAEAYDVFLWFTDNSAVCALDSRGRVAVAQERKRVRGGNKAPAEGERLSAGQGEPAHCTRNAENINTIGL